MSDTIEQFLEYKEILDINVVLNNLGGDKELFVELAQIFMEESLEQLEEIRKSLQAGDISTVQRAAHTLKGSVATLAAQPTYHAALEVEMLARKGDVQALPSALATLEREVNRLRSTIGKLLAST